MRSVYALFGLFAWNIFALPPSSSSSSLSQPVVQANPENLRVKLRKRTNQQLGKRATDAVVNNLYWLTLGVGTPPQDLNFLPDSGANNFAVYSTLLPKDKQGDSILYDPSKSSSARKLDGYTWSQFGSGPVYNETIIIGTQIFTNVPLCVADNNGGPSYYDRTGNLGMNPYDQYASPKYLPSLMHTIMGRLPNPIATFSFNYFLDEGEVDFGFIDTTKYTGPMTYLGVAKDAFFWSVHCDGIVDKNGNLVPNTAFDAILDHGTYDARVPKVGLDAYFRQVSGAVYNAGAETYDFPCDADLPDFGFSIGLLPVKVNKKSWLTSPVDGTTNTCRSLIKVPSDGSNSGFFGAAFLGSVFVVFDYKNNRVGLANRPADGTTIPTLPNAGTLKLCQGTSFTGTCTNSNWQSNTCVSLVGTPFYKNIGSYQPSKGYCTLHSDDHCASPLPFATAVRNPGIPNTFGYQNMIGSYACFWPSDYPIRSQGTFRACTQVGFRGTCQNFGWSSFACQNLPTSLTKNFLSARTDKGYCYLYKNRDCTGAVEDGAPFVHDEDRLPVGKYVQSFMCV